MTILTVTIKKKKAIKTLEQLRADDLIDFSAKKSTIKKRTAKDKTETHLASERSLAKDWLTSKEDKAWQDL
ncbi:MAG: DUF2281 domain-containing protein [Chitinophagaceae bacterium]|nr:MAG: DUF2281 domain-containing protein [Chitinophagaceae bacterium]